MNMKFFAPTITFLLTCLLLTPACADYKAKPLPRLGKTIRRNSSTQSISFAYHSFSVSDCKKYLGRNVISEGYQPVQITFTNNSNQTYIVSASNFSLPSIDPAEVAKKAHFSVTNRVVGYGVGAIVVWPLIAPAIIEGINGPKANEALDEDYEHKVVHNQVLKPYSIVNGIIFVPKESFDVDFTFTLVNKSNKQELHFSSAKLEFKL